MPFAQIWKKMNLKDLRVTFKTERGINEDKMNKHADRKEHMHTKTSYMVILK